ncbi:type VI secretion system baseplate subunit TssF [Rahnella woolbedingensis]|nr:type VI secretion system baseplate subunit TssF [Rahnella woolbedingensis]
MNNDERYYREELDYLRQLAKMLAIENPHLKSFLESKDSEHEIERLFEAFSILSGHVRTRIEDSFPEITHPLLHNLWPNYLRPTPSMTIIEYVPDVDEITMPVVINKGMFLQSDPVQAESVNQKDKIVRRSLPTCTFTLSRDVWLMPLHIDTINAQSSLKNSKMDITISISRLTDLNTLDLNKLRFWLNGEDEYTRYQLYLWLSVNTVKLELLVGKYNIPQPDMVISAAGFERSDALLPYPENSSDGFRILQEYLCYPDSFMFFDIAGSRNLPLKVFAEKFTLRIHFNTPFPPDLNIRNTTLRLHCSPAVNTFPHESKRLNRNEGVKSHPVLFNTRHQEYYDIFSISHVKNKIRSGDKRKGKTGKSPEQYYQALNNIRGRARVTGENDPIYYHLRQLPSLLHNRFDHRISFVHADGRPASLPESGKKREEITLSMICTNREIPEFLRTGDINCTTEINPAVISFTNITRPTFPLPPVTAEQQHWSLLSSMNLSYLTLLDVEGIRQVIRDFDLSGIYHPNLAGISAKKLEAIERIDTQPLDLLFKRIPVRGSHSTLFMQPSVFSCTGEMYLLGTVLSYVFAMYSSENSFHMLKMVVLDTQECFEWEARKGQHKLM